ncbi:MULTISPECIES: PfkB family carbohydrate kinase [Aneurinibacillus]|jgi:fructokinase|uniref:Fructokinase n=1 Tax=Aneurinibacillus danicus TaxID=267746 RepID=A0A511V3K6_9BACL|nr:MULTISPECIES: PfkB family carbohydrate kinase [Aneurinibacillus]GEN33496.1 fructokinase [Aneurinibacillus danicus]
MKTVLALGEMLVDFVPERNGQALEDVMSFKKAPGGAPANVAAAVARLGGSSRFLGKVGADPFGDFLVRTLADAGVDTREIRRTNEAKTGLAFVSLKEDGERDFLFYRDPSADMLLAEDEITHEAFENGAVFHFGSISLIADPARSATVRAARLAREKGLIISYDPNLRLPLWPGGEAEARKTIRTHVPLADIVKVSEEELTFLTGESDVAVGSEWFFAQGVRLLLVTLGKEGCAYVRSGGMMKRVGGFSVQVVDATGAGDGFVGGFLHRLVEAGVRRETLAALPEDELASMIRFANAVGALTTTKRGAISALPTLDEVQAFAGE